MTAVSDSPGEIDSEAMRALQIIESMPGHAWSADSAGRFTYVSPNTLEFLGTAREDLNTSEDEDEFGWRRFVHPDDYDRVAARWRHCLKTGDHYDTEHRLRRADGVYRWFRNSGRPSRDDQGRITQWYGTTIDIEDEKRAEAALRDRERELSQLVDMVPSHLWRLTPDGEPIFFNKRMVDFLGIDVADTDKPGMSRLDAVIETIHPDDAAEFRDTLSRCLVTGEHFSMRYRLRRADGVYRWMSSRADPLRDQGGRIVQWYGLCHDIDDQMHAEEALRRSERQLQQLIDTVPVQIWCATPSGEPAYINKTMVDYIGLKLEDFDAQGGLPSAIQTIVHPDDRTALLHALTHAYSTGEPFEMKFRNRRWDGSYRWTEGSAEPLRDESGRIIRWYGVNVDIHDMITSQEAAERSERQLREIIDAVPVRIWSATPTGGPIYFNKRYQDHFRSTIADFEEIEEPSIEKLLQELIHPEDAPIVQDTVRNCFETGRGSAMRFRWREKDGAYRWVECRVEPRRDENGVVVHWYGVSLDIDDEMRAQEALRERERELSQLVDMVPSFLWRLTPEGEPNFFNKRLIDFLGLDITDADKPETSRLAAILESIIHSEDLAGVKGALNRSIATGERFAMRFRLRRADGIYRWVDGGAEPMRDQNGQIVQWYGLCHDIDDEMRLYRDIEEREARIRRLIDSDIIGIVIWDLDGRLIDANNAFLRMVQYEREDVNAGLRWFDMTPPEWQEVHARTEAEELRTTGKMQAREKEYFRKDGSRVPVLIGAACFEGQSRQGVAYILDLTEQKRAEAALRDRERELSQLVETLPAMIDCATPDGEPIYRSKQFREFLGYELEELDTAGKSRLDGTLDAGIHPDDLAGAKETYAHALATGEPCARRFRMRRFDGKYRWVEARAAPIRSAEGAIVQWNVVCMDIEEQVQAQEALRLAQERLARANQAASLAELSASIAHEVNQPLAAVVANSHACQRWLTAEPPNIERARKTIERITRDANAAADVVSRIRALFKQSAGPRSFTTLDGVIAEARDLMAEEATRRSVRMDVEVESDLPFVAFDRIQIQQVLINLIRNGMEAMDSVASDRVLRMRVRRMGDVVRTEVSDCGRGLEFPERIFEPFFTTKKHGMGMGLPICRSVVESHGGRLWAEKNEPCGTTFVFALPVETKAAP